MFFESAENKTEDRIRSRSRRAENPESLLRPSRERLRECDHRARRLTRTRIVPYASAAEPSSVLAEGAHCWLGDPNFRWPSEADPPRSAPNARPALLAVHPPQAQSRRRRSSLPPHAGYILPLSCARSPRT